MTNKPAILGGEPVRQNPLPTWNTIGEEERQAINRVLEKGVLSDFIATWSDKFSGGIEVQSLEKEWADSFKVKHAISVNSATSGLYASIGALGLGPGDEVIVTPTSMSASATAPLVYGAIPVFADISQTTFGLDPQAIEKVITDKTKAILVVHLFGGSADMDGIRKLAQKHSLKIIEDSAQAPGATYKGDYVGTLGDIGVFSLNCHKHIQTGEGGIIVTNDDKLAERLKLIRNHAEAVVEAKGENDLTNMVGFNYRMTEIEASMARCQLQKLSAVNEKKITGAHKLIEQLQDIPGLIVPTIDQQSQSVYYTLPICIQTKELGLTREKFTKALNAEGIPLISGYVKPLYLAPLFQKQIAFGSDGYPFTAPANLPGQNYRKGLCPIAEKLYFEELTYLPWCSYDFDDQAIADTVKAIRKIVEHKDHL